MNDSVYHMMLHIHKNKINKKYSKKNDICKKSCIKNDVNTCKTKHVRFEGEWCTFFRFMYN